MRPTQSNRMRSTCADCDGAAEFLELPPWSPAATTSTDCTFQQLAPYIGRIKTTIARHLIEEYTRPRDFVVDPFCGSGVIPLEAALKGCSVLGSDTNPYGVLLTRAKLLGPQSHQEAVSRLDAAWSVAAGRRRLQDLRRVPLWVRRFFHPQTLRNALALRDELVEREDWFLLACLLGILHHQRPGFLSYPSSHLVPYLRDKLFPEGKFPEMYEERDVYSRLVAKINRTFRRAPDRISEATVRLCDSRELALSRPASVIITSPPYMNELDYVRDNRLRLWFLERHLPAVRDISRGRSEAVFRELMRNTLCNLAPQLAPKGSIILIVGDASRGGRSLDSAEVVTSVVRDSLPAFKLVRTIRDHIPDVRRSRRDLRGTKQETVLVFTRRTSSRKRAAQVTPGSGRER